MGRNQARRISDKRAPMHPTLRAGLWMTGTITAFSAMAVAGRHAGSELDTFEIMLFRSIIGFAVVVLIAGLAGRLAEIRLQRMDLHLMRNLSHFTGQNLWFYAVTVIPLAQVFALEFTMPLWVVLLSPLVLGERLTLNRVAAALAGFVGILIVTRPDAQSLNAGVIAAALAAIGFAGSAVFTRKLTRSESITSILFWLTVIQGVLGLICASWDGDITLPSAHALPSVGVIALCGLLAHFCLTKALSLAPATVIIPIDFARLPVIALVGMLLYREPVDPLTLLGAVVIFTANYLNILHETRNPIGVTKT
jgi:drug/metabolite transporter (DMT)-like permease